MSNAAAARDHLINALEADLVGPFRRKPDSAWSDAGEVLEISPSRWYLTGFLAPHEGREDDQPEDDDNDALPDADDREDNPSPDPAVKQPRRLQSSMGMSVFVPKGTASLVARVSWADYERQSDEPDEGKKRRRHHWSRIFRGPVEVAVPLDANVLKAGIDVPFSNGVKLQGAIEKAGNALSVAIFVVNHRSAATEPGARDEAFLFQVRLELECAAGFVPRTNDSDESSEDLDERINDLQYRNHSELAVGHGVSVEELSPQRVATQWLPRVDVAPVVPRQLKGLEVGMEALAALTDPEAARGMLTPMVAEYREWIGKQRAVDVGSARRKETQVELMHQAERAAARIEEGLKLLVKDADAFQAFRWMNQLMAEAERKARPDSAPSWRLFQLAFILLNLPAANDAKHDDRELVELIFFPTGGGKTQAYLGLIAWTLLMRRIRGHKAPHGGLGVAVLLRYTLRLLTLDQLGRAATLICALELLRRKTPTLGEVRFSIGLWVGRSATANTLEQVAREVTEFKNDTSPRAQSPFPLTHCPWCGEGIKREGFVLTKNGRPNRTDPDEITVACMGPTCPFSFTQGSRDGLPVLFVDEQIYRELPCFVVATVDKFALLPWRGETGMLFGRAQSRTGRRFYGPCDGPDVIRAQTASLPEGLPPPELIVQDELHLISGPLGSMVGLYESALLALCDRARIIASTATVRRAHQQVERLYGRRVALFPPPGIDASETFFACVDTKAPARRYLGVAAAGRPSKTVLLRTYIALLSAAGRCDPKDADAYLTLVGYFNSLRELGGMRRLVEDDVRQRTHRAEQRRPLDFDEDEDHPWFRSRQIRGEPLELTSREKTLAIKEAKSRLTLPHSDKQSVDVALASNMISVGVDIDRLGLMVIAGQPKTTSEYIQASSRVGRNRERPGLVVTSLNVSKPRDRSHYERFLSFHRSFYRNVEATSVTPFSGPALDRGLAGVLVALARLFQTAMTAPLKVMELEKHRAAVEERLKVMARRAPRGYDFNKEEEDRAVTAVVARGRSLLDAWQAVVLDANKSGADRAYSPLDLASKGIKALLRAALDPAANVSSDELRFTAPLSMRDVEPTVHLWLTRQPLGGFSTPRKAR